MLTQHQDDLYVLFKEIDGICRKYNIEYAKIIIQKGYRLFLQ